MKTEHKIRLTEEELKKILLKGLGIKRGKIVSYYIPNFFNKDDNLVMYEVRE